MKYKYFLNLYLWQNKRKIKNHITNSCCYSRSSALWFSWTSTVACGRNEFAARPTGAHISGNRRPAGTEAVPNQDQILTDMIHLYGYHTRLPPRRRKALQRQFYASRLSDNRRHDNIADIFS